MGTAFYRDTYDTISQRAVASYCRGLCAFEPVATSEDEAASQRDLHAFFTALYTLMFERPARFGMPVTPDDSLASVGESTDRKAVLNRKLKRPRDIAAAVVGLLQGLARAGRLAGGDLLVNGAEYRALLPTAPRTAKAILAGMADVGLTVVEGGEGVTVRNAWFPLMMPALKAMAEQCALLPGRDLPIFCFARGDFRALRPGYQFDPLALLAYFDPEPRGRALRLHEFLLATGHQPLCRVYGMHGWDMQYQGPRKIKASPLVQFDYSERHRDPFQVYIKCASTDRLLPFFAEQPEALRDDFRRRVYRCGAPSCTWCKTRKNLGPSLLEHRGEKLAICWYTKPDMPGLSGDTFRTLQGYIHWHQKLA